MPADPPPRLSIDEMAAIIARQLAAVKAAGQSLPALYRYIGRQVASDWADDKAMKAEFAALLAELSPGQAERLKVIDEFNDIFTMTMMTLQGWRANMAEAWAAGEDGQAEGHDDE